MEAIATQTQNVGAQENPAALRFGGGQPLDPAWCNAELRRVSRTFALNTRCLHGSVLATVRLAYLLCRAADTLEDAWRGTPAAIAERFGWFLAGLDGDGAAADALARAAAADARAATALLVRYPDLLATLPTLPPADAADVRSCVRFMASGMRRYAVRAAGRGPAVPYLDDDAELHDYCHVVAGCVGEMLTSVIARRIARDDADVAQRRRALAPVVGEALQLTNIVLDWPVDLRRGRCYVPASWLARHALVPGSLVGDSPAARELALRLAGLAHAALDRVPEYLETIPTNQHRYRLFCLLPALWARASLDLALSRPDFHRARARPRLARARVFGEALRALLVHASHGATTRALARRG